MTFINGFPPLTYVTKILQRSIDVEEVVHPSLSVGLLNKCTMQINSMHNINYINHNLSTF